MLQLHFILTDSLAFEEQMAEKGHLLYVDKHKTLFFQFQIVSTC